MTFTTPYLTWRTAHVLTVRRGNNAAMPNDFWDVSRGPMQISYFHGLMTTNRSL
ncbi:unnamed protein product [Ixodes persulcatus]